MPAPPAVALRGDQHMFAECRQILAAQRAGIRGGLAVLGSSHVPPRRAIQLGHPSKDVTGEPWHGIFGAVEHRDERIVVETGRHRITGVLRLPKDGYRSRLTDYLNSAERNFLPLTEVEIVSLDGAREPEHRAFLALALAQIVMAMPADAGQVDEQ